MSRDDMIDAIFVMQGVEPGEQTMRRQAYALCPDAEIAAILRKMDGQQRLQNYQDACAIYWRMPHHYSSQPG